MTTERTVGGALRRFFTNQSRFDFIGRSQTWMVVSLALLAICAASLVVRGLNFGIDFTGGTAYVVTDAPHDFTAEGLRAAVTEAGAEDPQVQVVDGGEGALVTTPAIGAVGGEQQRAVLDAIVAVTGTERAAVDVDAVGPRWGAQISEQALRALGVFLLLVVAYITLRFEWRMALAALVTLLHDIAVTVGIYALIGFQVSPASVIALLTILGYSLYDTVVVFDRITDDTRAITSTTNRTYGEIANEALNQVLLRSLSTSVTSLLPVGSLLLIGAQLLGADTLSDLALALFIGIAIGTYSSIFVATPFLVFLKEREPRFAEQKRKILARRGGGAAAAAQRPATAPSGGGRRSR